MSARKKRVEIAYDTGAAAAHSEVPFASAAMFPEEGDNCAVAKRVIEKGTVLAMSNGSSVRLERRVLEGHRFAVTPLAKGTPLLSWGLPFGVVTATAGVSPGEYLCNSRMIESLTNWGIKDLPKNANFDDYWAPYRVQDAKITDQVPLLASPGTFQGFRRPGKRGFGTRNYVVVIGTTSLSAPLASAVEARCARACDSLDNVDGVVAIAHTEGGAGKGNNHGLLLRTLAGFAVHPNVAACVIVDRGDEDSLTAADVRDFLRSGNAGTVDAKRRQAYSMDSITAEFLSLPGDFETAVATCVQAAKRLVSDVQRGPRRTACPLSGLSVALQCGGSDAFSGVSGNPAAGWAAKMLIQNGGKAVLAETDELIGAESYVLRRVRSRDVARVFTETTEAFKTRFSWHGQTAEANPSGGNNLRGLYNIALKSIGAGKKKHADVRLDGVLKYGERAPADRGYFFMDSPGNDLESIAGQVATGCNFIFFVTGNGSITNFPFVPTIKIMTTSRRFALLERDMDFNAGRFQEGIPMDKLGAELFRDMVAAASGNKTKGEKAGHAQVSIWRNWTQTQKNPKLKQQVTEFAREIETGPVRMQPAKSQNVSGAGDDDPLAGWTPRVATVGVVLPTSLCSGQIAKLICEDLTKFSSDDAKAQSSEPLRACMQRYLAFPHTEGCGSGYAHGEDVVYKRLMLGHLTHPAVRLALLLEHGCEKTHNSYMRVYLRKYGAEDRFGYASVQLDGGIERVRAKAADWFKAQSRALRSKTPVTPAALGEAAQKIADGKTTATSSIASRALKTPVVAMAAIGGLGCARVSPALARTAADLVFRLVKRGFRVVMPDWSALLREPVFVDTVLESKQDTKATLAFGQAPSGQGGGLDIMRCATKDWGETLTGCASAGCVAAIVISQSPVVGHLFVPVIRIQQRAPEPLRGDDTPKTAQTHLQKSGSGWTLRARLPESFQQSDKWCQSTTNSVLGALKVALNGSFEDRQNVVFQLSRGVSGVSA